MWHIGLDDYLRTSTLCILDEQGREVNLKTIKGHPRRVVEFLSEVTTPFAICFEASSGYGWLAEFCVACLVMYCFPVLFSM